MSWGYLQVLELKDKSAEGRVYGNLGNVHCAMGHYNKALKLHHQVSIFLSSFKFGFSVPTTSHDSVLQDNNRL